MVKLILVSLILATVIIAIAQSKPSSVSWTHELSLDRGVEIKWTTVDPVWLIMEMSAPTVGYVSVGFSPNPGMTGSDIVLGWVDENGVGYIKDYYATTNGRPIEDPQQDYELLKATESDNRTTIQFRRKWNTCDKEHDNVIEDDTIRIIWAYNNEDPPIVDGKLKPAYHGPEIRGVRRAYIRNPQQPSIAISLNKSSEAHVKHWDVQMHNNSVNQEDDILFCTIAKFENLQKKHHMIGFEPLLDEANKFNIHHMMMYECIVPSSDGGTAKHFEEHVAAPGGRCYTPNMAPAWGSYCINVPILWTSGSEGSMFPDNVGFPLGEEHGGSTYFMFEIHYDNPQLKSFTDSSGFRILYTDKLRENDGSVLAVGHKISPLETVPHAMPSFNAMGYCTSECTSQVIPPTGINVIGVLLHAHYAGRKIVLKHLRNGKELAPIAKEKKYDYNYQQSRVIEPNRKILPGDELITICNYDTTGRTKPAFGGIGTRDEMCMSFVYYYPRIPLAECKSGPEFYSYLNALGIQKVNGDILKEMNLPYIPKDVDSQPLEYPDGPFNLKNSSYANPLNGLDAMNIIEADKSVSSYPTVGDAIRNLNWAGPQGKSIEKKWIHGKHYAFCTAPNKKRYALKDYIVSLPKYEKFVKIVDQSCPGSANNPSADVTEMI